MKVNDIIEAIRNGDLTCDKDMSYRFISVGDELVQAGVSHGFEESIHMLLLNMEAVRAELVRHGKECGYAGASRFEDSAAFMAFLIEVYGFAVASGEFKELFDMSQAQTSAIRYKKI